MRESYPGAGQYVPAHASFPVLRDAIQTCHGCELYRAATQAVFGEGPGAAKLLLVGEQPGNEEDRYGRPFVGPAGRLLDLGLAQAGIERSHVFVTNAVKHFKFEERGKRRIHKKPSTGEVKACHPWLEAELEFVKPTLIGCLGATAAQSVLGPGFRVSKDRGQVRTLPSGHKAIATVHPSAILRAPDADQREAEFHAFVGDLIAMREFLTKTQG